MVMRSIYWILACSLMFAAVMVMGVSMQSCKSKKLVQSTSAVDSVGVYYHHSVEDSLFFEEFIRRCQKRFEIDVTWYSPIKDSTGKVTGSVPEKKLGVKVDVDSSTHKKNGGAVRLAVADSTEAEVRRKESKEERPPPDEYKIFFLFLLLALFFVHIKK